MADEAMLPAGPEGPAEKRSRVYTASTDMAPEQRAFLDAIAGGESPDYATVYGGQRFTDFTDHPRIAVPITSGPNAGKTSSAAGRYQFLGSTWDNEKTLGSLPDFSAKSQDVGAWNLAARTYTSKTGGRDLLEDLKTNSFAPDAPQRFQRMGTQLGGVWTSLPSGIEPNSATSEFGTRLSQRLAFYRGNPDFTPTLTVNDLQPPPAATDLGKSLSDAQRMAEREKQASYWAGTKDAFNLENLTVRLFQSSPELVVDPNYRIGPQNVTAWKQAGVREENLDRMAQSTSQANEQWQLARVLEEQGKEQNLSDLGWGGTGLRIAAGMLDPIAITAGVATGGLADAAIVAKGAGTAARVFAQAGAGALSNVALEEGLRQTGAPGHGQDMLMAAAMGGLFGSAYGLLSRNPATAAEAARIASASRSLKNELQSTTAITPPSNKSVGAAVNPNADYDILEDAAFKAVQNKDVAETALGKLRFDAVGQLKSSNNPIARLIGSVLGEDAVGNKGHSINPFGASEEMEVMHRAWAGDYRRSWIPAYKEWADEQGLNVFQRWTRGSDFNEEVYRYVVNTDPQAQFAPSIKRVGDKLRDLNKQVLDLANNPLSREGMVGRPVRGFGTVPENPNYMMRSYDQRKLNDVRERFGDRGVTEWFKGAMRSAQPDLEDEVVDRIAGHMSRRLHLKANEIDENFNLAIHGDQDRLAGLLRDAGLNDQDIGLVLRRMAPDEQAGADPRGKRRILLDENYVLRDYQQKQGGVGNLALTDMVMTDASHLSDIYFRHMAGRIALSRVRVKNPTNGELLVNGITSDGDFESVLDRTRRYAADQGEHERSVTYQGEKVSQDEANMRFLYDRVLGRADPQQQTKAAEMLRMIRKFNFTRVMGQVGFAQIAEFSNTIAQLGVKAALSHMPAFRRVINMDGQTVLRHGLDQELEAIFGVGTDRLRGMQHFRTDEFGHIDSGFARGLNNALDYGQRAVADLSGMHVINMALQRWTAKAVAQKFTNIALNPTKANMRRMASLGLDEAMLGRISGQIKDHFDTVDGMLFGKKVNRMNLDKWVDQEARSHFENGLNRWSRRIIQENDIGAMHRWSSNPLWQMMFQFRNFTITAWAKQFLHNVHMRDMESFNTMWMTMAAASAVYGVQTNLQALGRSDKDKFLEDRLAPSKIALAAFNRAGWSSIMPMGIDTASMLTGNKPFFDFRTTGQPTDIMFGNPTMSLIDDVNKASKGLVSPWKDGHERSQQEYRNIARVFPLQNWMPAAGLLSTMIHQAPERAPKN